MSSRTFRGGLKIAGSALGLAMAAVGLIGGVAWAERAIQSEAAQVNHQPLFMALDQWMTQNTASYNLDLGKLKDPFLPIKMGREDPNLSKPVVSVFTQLKLVAITTFSDASGALASFEDGFGASYNLRAGDRIGPNNERVVSISGAAVTVETPGRDSDEPARLTEIKLPTPGLTAGLARSGEALQIQRAD